MQPRRRSKDVSAFFLNPNEMKKIMMNKITWALCLILSVIGLWACASRSTTQSDGYTDVGVAQFEEALADRDNTVLLDVRTAAEYAAGHLPGALLIDANADTFSTAACRLLPRGKTIAVYCRSGRRSAHAANLLSQKGYRVINLKGGITAWQEEGRAVEQ